MIEGDASTKQTPGPRPVSCITCRRRKKKCDRARPFCARCSQGGYECLGYGRELPLQATESSAYSTATDLNNWDNQLEKAQEIDSATDSSSCVAIRQFSLGYSMPPRFIPHPEQSGATIQFIVSHYEPLFYLVFFRPMQALLADIRGRFINRIVSSNVVYWSSFVGAQMFGALKQDKEDADVGRYIPWLDRLDSLCVAPDDTSLDGMRSRLSGALEITFLKYITSNARSGYTLLRRIAPVFMHIALADPTLWPRDPLSSGVSLAHALASGRYEIGRFIFVDAISSLTFGVPPLVEYDPSHPPIHAPGAYPSEWVHGCPVQFAFAIIRVNQWRASRPNDHSVEDTCWKEIERDIWAWRSACDYGPDSESGRLVMRFAIQEGWRHAVLIYLYMGMCGFTSHDPRVQSSVQQISRLHTVIQSQFASGMHPMIPFLIAGIGTRSEADRRKYRAAISIAGPNKTWLLKGVEFSSVLDHLWRGVAKDGGAVTWDDYVASRRAVIDVGV